MFELKILTDLSTMPKRVETNIDEVEPIIKSAIARVEGLVVTEKKEDILAADADAAKLTKMAKAIQRFRIDHIALWKEPMEAFEAKCKDAEKRLTEAADTLRTKTSEVKDMWREKKRQLCAGVWAAKLAEAFAGEKDVQESAAARAYFDLWTNPKTKGTWVNSSVDIRAVEEAMDEEVELIRRVLDAVAANYANADDEVKMKARKSALASFDMNAVIAEVNAYVAEREEMERAKAELAAKRQAQAAQAAQAAANPVPAASATPTPPNPPTPQADAPATPAAAPASDAVETYRLAVTGKRSALIALRQYGQKLGITFKNLDK